MLLKYSQSEKKSKLSGNARQQRSAGNMKLMVGASLGPRLPRKTVKGFATKRPSSQSRPLTGKDEHRTPVDACDNSNDSGLGFDQHLDISGALHPTLRLSDRESLWISEHPEVKRTKLEIKLESDDATDNFSFSHAMSRSHKSVPQTGGLVSQCLIPARGTPGGSSGLARSIGNSESRLSPSRLQPRSVPIATRRPAGPVSLSTQLVGTTRDGKIQLQITSQPEQQHRARYQTEGSRGAVKDRSGNGFPIVKLIGYNKPTTLQVFIGTDMGRVAPHMFYQACKVSGKNSTPCVEKKIEGTIVIEVDFDPSKDMTITCDCVGILKERNVDVEHRFPEQTGARNKKKSTRCRMVFRTTVTLPDGSTEILQISSQPIVCTQPPGVPEISKKSLTACPCTGGMELFILGKNFLKDTHVIFQQNDVEPIWEESVQPDKEFLQQTHLVCTVPAYQHCDILEPVVVRLLVTSSGKTSEPHTFTYTPVTNPVLQPAVSASDISPCLTLASSAVPQGAVDLNRVFSKPPLGPPSGLMLSSVKAPAALITSLPNQFLSVDSSNARAKKDVPSTRMWSSAPLTVDSVKAEELKNGESEQSKALGIKMMPPPLLPISACRSSANVRMIIPDPEPAVASELKTENIDESSRSSAQLSPEDLKGIDLRMKPETVLPVTVSDLLSTQSPSLATFRRFVSNPSDTPLPTQSGLSVEKYLSHIENPPDSKSSMESGVQAADVSVVEMTMNKLRNSEKVLGPQFGASLVFSSSQQSTSNLLSSTLTSAVSESSPKVSFVNDVPLRGMFNSTSPVVEKESQKSHLVEQVAIQEAIAARTLLSVGLDNAVSTNQQKTDYETSSLSNICPTRSISSVALLPSVTESQLNTFTSTSIPSTTVPSALGVSTVLDSIAQSSNIIENATSLIFNNSQQAQKTLLPNSLAQEGSEQMIERVGKSNVQQTGTVSSLPSPHEIPLLTSPPGTNSTGNLNVQGGSVPLRDNILSVNETETSLINSTPGTRLDALVSSAIESRILEANRQTHAEKLNALVNSAAGSLISVSTENSVLQASAARNQIVLSGQDMPANQNGSSPVQDLTALNSQVSSFQMNTLSSSQPTVHITQENVILNNTVTAAFGGHILGSETNTNGKDLRSETVVLNNIGEQGINIDTHDSNSNTHIMISSPTRTSPIAMKNMILGSPNTSNSENLMVTNSVQSPPVGKTTVASPPSNTEVHVSNSCSPPIAMKSLLLTSPQMDSRVLNSNIDVKDILSTSVDGNLPLASSSCTSPIALKKIILESSASSVRDIHNTNSNPPTIAVKSILNSQVKDSSLIPETVSSDVNLSREKLNAFVHSSVGKCLLTSSRNAVPVTTEHLSLRPPPPTPCNATTNTIPLHTHSLATILESTIPSDMRSNATLLSPNSSIPPVSPPAEVHSANSVSPNSVQSHSPTLTSAQSLQNEPAAVLASQSQTIAEDSLLAMYSVRNSDPGKSQDVQNNSAPVVSSSALLDHHITTMFVGQQCQSNVLPTGSIGNVPALGHTGHFSTPSTSSIMSSSTISPKAGSVTSEGVNDTQVQARLINQVLLNLAVENSGSQLKLSVNPENPLSKTVDSSKYIVTDANSNKIPEDSVECSSNVLVTELTVKATQMQQPVQERNHAGQHSQREQVVSSNTALSVPGPEIASGTANKESVTVPSSGQKKMEEGMVPQELTQMSDSDLISYINPSCFDQV